MKLVNFFKGRSTTFWAITGIVVTIFIGSVSSVITLWAGGHFDKIGPHLRIEATQQSLLVDVDKAVAPDVSVTYQDEKVANLRLIQIKVANVGTEGIVGRTDVIDSIKFSFPEKPDIKLLGKPTIGQNPQEVDVKLESSNSSREFATNFDLLNPDNYFTLNFLYSASEPRFPKVTGKVKNVPIEELTLKKGDQSVEGNGLFPSQWWGWLLFIIGVMIVGILLFIFISAIYMAFSPFSTISELTPKFSGENLEKMIEEGNTRAAILVAMVGAGEELEDIDFKELFKNKEESTKELNKELQKLNEEEEE